MTTPAAKLPTWATATTVATGADTGLSTRLEPSAGTLASGHLADTRSAARVENWVKGNICDWVSALAPIAYSTWSCWRCAADTVASDWFVRAAPYLDGYHGFWNIPLTLAGDGSDSQTDKHPSPLAATGAHQITAVVDHGTLGNLSDQPISAASSPTVSVIGFDAASIAASTVLSVPANALTGTVVTLAATNQPIKTVYSPLAGLFLAYPAGISGWVDGGTYWTSTDGLSFTARTISGFTGPTTVSSIAVGAHTGGLAIGFLGTTMMAASIDGINWTVSARGGTNYTVGLCETAAGWLALDSGGELWRYNGTAWVSVGTIADGPNSIGALYHTAPARWLGNFMASDGGRAVLILTSDSGRLYVKLSLDEGLTWRDVGLAHQYNATRNWIPAGVSYSDGQFAAVVYGTHPTASDWVGHVFFSAKM